MQHATSFFFENVRVADPSQDSPKRPQEPWKPDFQTFSGRCGCVGKTAAAVSVASLPGSRLRPRPGALIPEQKSGNPSVLGFPVSCFIAAGAACLPAPLPSRTGAGVFSFRAPPRQTVVRGPAAAGAAVCRGLSIVRCGATSGGRASTPCGRRPGRSRLRAAPVRSRAGACAGRPPSRGCARHRPV